MVKSLKKLQKTINFFLKRVDGGQNVCYNNNALNKGGIVWSGRKNLHAST